MNLFRRALLGALTAPLVLLAAGCTGADNPKIPEVPAYVPTAADKAEPKGKPPGYGQGDQYKKAMEEMEKNQGR